MKLWVGRRSSPWVMVKRRVLAGDFALGEDAAAHHRVDILPDGFAGWGDLKQVTLVVGVASGWAAVLIVSGWRRAPAIRPRAGRPGLAPPRAASKPPAARRLPGSCP